MRKIAIVATLSLGLAGCEPSVSNLLLPMEPTQDSIGAPRRALTDDEKETISDAVALKMKEANRREFKWAPLVVRSHDQATDYCGLVSGNDRDDHYAGFSKYYAHLKFDNHGKLIKVDVQAIDKSGSDELPTKVDSICVQDGYTFFAT